MFDNLPAYKRTSRSRTLTNEFQLFLSMLTERVSKPLLWWYKKRHVYPWLYCMALNYLSIPGQFTIQSIPLTFYELIFLPATLVEVKWLSSHGRLILSHTCSYLSAQSTCALLCVGSWSLVGLVLDEDVEAVAMLDEIKGKLELDRLAHVLGKTY